MPYPNNQKPVNIFYVWYSELCRRLNSTPAPVVKPAKPKCPTVLDFVADRLKVEEWSPVINALRHDTSLHVIAIKSRIGNNCQFLHDVDTEEKVRKMKRRYGTLWTAFILKSLLKSLSCAVRNNQVLTCLQFDGLPLFVQYLEPLLKALQKNKTLKNLSLTRCAINDVGCQLVCAYVRLAPNIEVLDLSGCGLTAESGEHLAKLIKYQQINRYCESWHNSLRYSDPAVNVMCGIKRITLNGNPFFGDSGLDWILNELDDDLWIKALDLQKCGITDNSSLRILDVVEYSQSLEIVDFRLNELLSISTMEKILNILKEKQINHQPEFQWCNTTFTLTCDSASDTVSNYTSIRNSVHKTKSAPLKPNYSKLSVGDKPVRRMKTLESVQNKASQNCKSYLREDVEKKVMELNSKLQEEIAKRKKTEKINQDLMRTLDEIRSNTSFQVQLQSRATPEKMPTEKQYGFNNGFKNGTTNGYHETNGFKLMLNGSAACTIFEKLVANRDGEEENDSDAESLLNYVQQDPENLKKNGEKAKQVDEMTASQISLCRFVESLKNNNANLPVKFKNRRQTSKYYVANKKVGQ